MNFQHYLCAAIVLLLWAAVMNMDYTEQLEVELAHVAQRCPAGAGREGAQ